MAPLQFAPALNAGCGTTMARLQEDYRCEFAGQACTKPPIQTTPHEVALSSGSKSMRRSRESIVGVMHQHTSFSRDERDRLNQRAGVVAIPWQSCASGATGIPRPLPPWTTNTMTPPPQATGRPRPHPPRTTGILRPFSPPPNLCTTLKERGEGSWCCCDPGNICPWEYNDTGHCFPGHFRLC